MKKICAALAISILLPIHSFADEIKYFHAPGWYPFTMKNDQTNEIYGASVDVMNEIAQNLNVKAVYEDVPWKRGFSLLDAGDVDVNAGAYDNAERREKYIFSIPFMENETRIFVKKDNMFKFDQLEDLKGKQLVKSLGSSFGSEFDTYAAENIQLMENQGKEAMFKMLQANRIEGVLMDYYDTMYYLRNNGLEDDIVALEKPVNTVDVFLLISKNSPYSDKIDLINQSIQQLIDSNKIDQILAQY